MGYTKLKKSHLIRHHIHKATSSEYFRVLILRTIGNFLIISSLFMIGKTFYKPVAEEARYLIDNVFNKKYVAIQRPPSTIKYPPSTFHPLPSNQLSNLIKFNQTEVLVPEDPQYSIIIPKIGANAKIIPNVDVSDETTYLDVLSRGVAQAAGTANPGESGHIFLFAHSTDYFWNVGTYNAIFYLLYKLERGDEVDIFYKNERYVYKVIGHEIVDPSQVQYLTRKTDKEFLTLQTCWPPGTTLQRLLVFATRVAE
jgi:LPXTG-site transpeptidase (sortase) family protein